MKLKCTLESHDDGKTWKVVKVFYLSDNGKLLPSDMFENKIFEYEEAAGSGKLPPPAKKVID